MVAAHLVKVGSERQRERERERDCFLGEAKRRERYFS
jgi:hypothetical protein